jgi:hypothetical protein
MFITTEKNPTSLLTEQNLAEGILLESEIYKKELNEILLQVFERK